MKDDLIAQRDTLEQQFKNLSDPQWVANQLNQIRAKYEILNDVINNMEQEDAKSKPEPKPTDSNVRKGK